MYCIDEERYRRGDGMLVSIEQEKRGYSSFYEAQRLMMDYARAMGVIVLFDPAGMSVVVDGEDGYSYRYVIYEK